MNPYYRNSQIQDADLSLCVNDNCWDRSTTLTIQHQGSHTDCDHWGFQMNDTQKSSGILGNEDADKSAMLHSSSYAIPPSYHTHDGSNLTVHNSGYNSQNAINSALSSVRSCGVLESLQDIMHTSRSSRYVNPLSAFPDYTAGSGLSAADFRSFDQSSHIQLGIVDVEQKNFCDLIKRPAGIYQTELHEALGLNLGGRTYFSADDYSSSWALGKRANMMNSPAVHVPRCQAEGCTADMIRAKHYYRRHKVCEQHSKALHIFANGQAQRFCQQCSRLHPVAEFDDAKRSCRKRLADHNRRRRKPQMIGSKSSKDYEDHFVPKVDENNQNEGNKNSGSDDSVTAALLVSATSWIPSTGGQLQLSKPQEAADHPYKLQKLQENPKLDSYLSQVASIRRGSGREINFQTLGVPNDIIPSKAPWLAHKSVHSKPAYDRKSFVNFQDSVLQSDTAISVTSSYQTFKSVPPSQLMIQYNSTQQKLKKQLGQLSVTHSNSDKIDADERTPSLPVFQASDLQQKDVETQSSNLRGSRGFLAATV